VRRFDKEVFEEAVQRGLDILQHREIPIGDFDAATSRHILQMLLDEFIEFDLRIVAFAHGIEERLVDFAESFLLLWAMENSLAEVE